MSYNAYGRYLPGFFRELREIQVLDGAISPEYDVFSQVVRQICVNNLVALCDEEQLDKYCLLYRVPLSGRDIARKRKAVLTKKRLRPPITQSAIEQVFRVVYGEGAVKIELVGLGAQQTANIYVDLRLIPAAQDAFGYIQQLVPIGFGLKRYVMDAAMLTVSDEVTMVRV